MDVFVVHISLNSHFVRNAAAKIVFFQQTSHLFCKKIPFYMRERKDGAVCSYTYILIGEY